jgi:hypothetical protein
MNNIDRHYRLTVSIEGPHPLEEGSTETTTVTGVVKNLGVILSAVAPDSESMTFRDLAELSVLPRLGERSITMQGLWVQDEDTGHYYTISVNTQESE